MAAKKTAPKPKLSSADIKRVITEKRSTADSAGLLADLIDVWGGTRQLATDMVSEFKGACEGSPTRQRILEMIQRLIISNTQQELSRPPNPDDLDDADLDAVILGYVARVSGVTDATHVAPISPLPGEPAPG